MTSFLHVLPDDKFWQDPIELFDEVGFSHRYVCVVNDVSEQLRYIKGERVARLTFEQLRALIISDCFSYVIFHSLPGTLYPLVISVPKRTKVVWCSWGFDIYYPQICRKAFVEIELYKSTTKQLVAEHYALPIRRILKRRCKSLLQKLLRSPDYLTRIRVEENKEYLTNLVCQRIDFMSTVLPCEFTLIQPQLNAHVAYFPFKYLRKDSFVNLGSFKERAHGILLGNSADPSNNHLDILELLRLRDVTNSLYIPMAYGEEWYRSYVTEFVRKNGFVADVQIAMLPYDAYMGLLLNCSCAIFGHMRQQAMGNVYACLLRGCKTFFYKDSITYKYLKSQGAFVFSIEEDLFPEAINIQLTEQEKETNYKIVTKLTDFFGTVAELRSFVKKYNE